MLSTPNSPIRSKQSASVSESFAHSSCPLFPVRRGVPPSVSPLSVADLELPVFQRHERTIVDTNRLYSQFQQMEREGRTSSLRPTILISNNKPVKPLTQTIDMENNLTRADPLSSTLDFHSAQKKTTEEDEYKTNDAWLQAEVSARKQYEYEQKQSEIEEESLLKQDDKYVHDVEEHVDVEDANSRLNHSIFISHSITASIDSRIESPISQNSSISAAYTPFADLSLGFSLSQLSAMLIAVIFARSRQYGSDTVSESSGVAIDRERFNAKNGMRILLVNVALVM